MRRGRLKMVADILHESKQRRAAPTRIASIAGVNKGFVNACIDSGLLEVHVTNHGKNTAVTEVGQLFLESFRDIMKLMPPALRPQP